MWMKETHSWYIVPGWILTIYMYMYRRLLLSKGVHLCTCNVCVCARFECLYVCTYIYVWVSYSCVYVCMYVCGCIPVCMCVCVRTVPVFLQLIASLVSSCAFVCPWWLSIVPLNFPAPKLLCLYRQWRYYCITHTCMFTCMCWVWLICIVDRVLWNLNYHIFHMYHMYINIITVVNIWTGLHVPS